MTAGEAFRWGVKYGAARTRAEKDKILTAYLARCDEVQDQRNAKTKAGR